MPLLAKVPTVDYANDPYTWDNQIGWKRWRPLRPGRGMYHDVRRRLPFYWSDIVDGFNYRTFAGCIRILTVNLLPALAFQLDMTRNTKGYFGINEALFSSALAAVVFSLFSCQPLTVVGITGLISLFNYTIYDITVAQGIEDLYPQFIAWVSIWAAITHWLAAIFNTVDYCRYITDFTTFSFALYVGIIYEIKGIEELIANFDDTLDRASGYLSVVIALLFWFTVSSLENIGTLPYTTTWLRKALSDYSYLIATIWWTGFSHFPSRLADTYLLRVPHTTAFQPTVDRSWLVPFWTLPIKWVFVALPIGILLTLLFYFDHNVSSLTAQAKQFPLTKPAGFHWDFFLLGITCFIGGIFGIPLPNGLVPQAPVHTDSCTEYQDVQQVTKEKVDEPDAEETVHYKKKTEAVKVMEQRISHFIMALAIIGFMTGPLLDVLHTIPRALFAGVFLVVGWGSIGPNPIVDNALFIVRERRFIDPSDPRLTLKRSRIAYYIAFQLVDVFISVAMSQTIGAIGFPVIILSLIPVRWCILPRIFTQHELHVLDAPTADADVVLASMGGQPERPEDQLAEKKRRNDAEAADNGDDKNGTNSSGFSNGSTANEGMRSRDRFKEDDDKEEDMEERRRDEDGIHPTEFTGMTGVKHA